MKLEFSSKCVFLQITDLEAENGGLRKQVAALEKTKADLEADLSSAKVRKLCVASIPCTVGNRALAVSWTLLLLISF